MIMQPEIFETENDELAAHFECQLEVLLDNLGIRTFNSELMAKHIFGKIDTLSFVQLSRLVREIRQLNVSIDKFFWTEDAVQEIVDWANKQEVKNDL